MLNSTDLSVGTQIPRCLGIDNGMMSIIWNWNSKAVGTLKGTLDKSQYRWEKSADDWILKVNLSYAPVIIGAFERLGLNCDQLKIPVATTKFKVALEVTRSTDVDTLEHWLTSTTK